MRKIVRKGEEKEMKIKRDETRKLIGLIKLSDGIIFGETSISLYKRQYQSIFWRPASISLYKRQYHAISVVREEWYLLGNACF